MAVVACPTPRTLAAFARGNLDAAEQASVEAHVAGCAACCRALQQMPAGTLAALAREAAAAPPTLQPGVTPAPVEGPPAAPAVQLVDGVPAALVNHPRYRVLSELGRGGMGTVYKAEDLWMSRTIALKVVSAHLTAKATALARFRKEVHAAAQLTHQNIVRAYDTGEAGGSQFLVMEYVEGMSLDKLVARRGRLSVPFACVLVRQAALGLQHAADKGMVHRDIKPHNLLVTSKGESKGQVKILDFGLARFASGDLSGAEEPPAAKVPFGAARLGKAPVQPGVTSPNSVMGTPDYMAPEQAANAAGVDARSDIYALGCTLYYLLTGRPPFAGTATLLDKLEAHKSAEPPSIRLERLEVTGELAAVIAKMMAKKPEDRYQTAAEVAAALAPFARADAAKGLDAGEAVTPPPAVPAPPPVPAARPKPVVVADTVPEVESRTVAEPARPRKKRKKRPSWWARNQGRVIGAAVACAVLAAVAFGATKIRRADWLSARAPDASAAKSESPPAAKADAGERPAPPTAIVPPKPPAVKVLYVLPTTGVWRSDYEPVRAQLERRGAAVVTAALNGGSAKLHADTPGADIPIDVRLTKTLNLSEYDAVVFAGAAVDELVGVGRGADEARWLMQQMQAAGKPVTAIGVGVAVPAHHGVLKGKRASPTLKLAQKFPYLNAQQSGINWDRLPGVATDGKFVTSSGEDGAAFADAVLRVIDGK